MALRNPDVDYEGELKTLREAYVASSPQSRYRTICQRLAANESDVVSLCTLVSAVEALARSIVLWHLRRSGQEEHAAYESVRLSAPEKLVVQALAALGKPAPGARFQGDTWDLFSLAVKFRHLVIHECTWLGGDKTRSLIAASREVLEGLAEDAGLHP
jgi:hypothetical protein